MGAKDTNIMVPYSYAPTFFYEWYCPKMAASIVQRCLTAAVKVKCRTPSFTGELSFYLTKIYSYVLSIMHIMVLLAFFALGRMI